jgi:hypothetical protein
LRSDAKSLLGHPLPVDANSLLQLPEYEFDAGLKTGGKQAGGPVLQFCLLEFDNPVVYVFKSVWHGCMFLLASKPGGCNVSRWCLF